MYIPSSKWTWALALAIIIQAIIGLALESYVFGQFQDQVLPVASDPNAATNARYTKAVPVQFALLVFAFIYDILLAYNALSNQNTIQIIGLVIMNIGITIYSGVQYDQINEARQRLEAASFISTNYWQQVKGTLIALPIVNTIFTFILAFIAWQLYKEFGWKIYKQIGADPKMKRRYLVYQIYITILKFDFFLFVGFAVQFLVLVSGTAKYEQGLTGAALPIVIILLFMAALSAQRENVLGTIISLIFYGLASAYFIYKLVRIWDSSRQADYLAARTTLTAFAIMTLLTMVVTICICIWVWTNYNRGLAEHTRRSHKPAPPPKEDLFMDNYSAQQQRPVNNTAVAAPPAAYPSAYPSRPGGGTRMEID